VQTAQEPITCQCGEQFPTLARWRLHAGLAAYTTHRKLMSAKERAEWAEVQRRVAEKKARGGWV
jgi:hypothetical protein